jgi:tRNA uridine 5-carboxymethylaminomethyl modification enzyme
MEHRYDVIVVGAGHAGSEAALAAARMGMNTLLLNISLDAVAHMSCNPAIGGLAKGQLVREVDALGGEMAKVIDAAGIQFRILNTSKGPAVRAPRAQADRKLYSQEMKRRIEDQPRLRLLQDVAEQLLVQNRKACGVRCKAGPEYHARTVILTTGTFLRGLTHTGTTQIPGGRMGEPAVEHLSSSLQQHGLQIGRLKTGTPPRVNGRTVDFSNLQPQYGDPEPTPFSFSTEKLDRPDVPCYLTYTNPTTHEIIRANLHRAPLYSGQIKSTGPRYCPSIEDKIVRFPEKTRHPVFLEPEGLNTHEIYCNGIPTSIPRDVQEEMVRSIDGLQRAQIMRYGYAVEYDFVPPTQITPWLETKPVHNLFLAGQINGTSGYEEAAAQGIIAGINAALRVQEKDPFTIDRSQAYIGVLIDDLVTKGTLEPYRMFTSRAEYRLVLRQDNADRRLMPLGHQLGLISDAQFRRLQQKEEQIARARAYLPSVFRHEASLEKLLRRPELDFKKLLELDQGLRTLPISPAAAEQVEIEVKYEGYISRQNRDIAKFRKMESRRIPDGLDFNAVPHLSNEAKQKLSLYRPISLGHASRISGVSPADLSVLMVFLEHRSRLPT